MPIARNHLQQRQNRRSAEDFSLRHFSDHYLFYQTNAAEIPEGLGEQGDTPFKRCRARRSSNHAGNAAKQIQCAKACMRRRADAFSRLVGTEFDRSTQSHARAVHVRRSQSADADRSEQGIPAPQRALFVSRHAQDRRRVFSYVPDQASAAISRLFGTRSPHNLSFTVRQTKLTCSARIAQYGHRNYHVSCFACYKRPAAFFADSLSAPAPFVSSRMREAVIVRLSAQLLLRKEPT